MRDAEKDVEVGKMKRKRNILSRCKSAVFFYGLLWGPYVLEEHIRNKKKDDAPKGRRRGKKQKKIDNEKRRAKKELRRSEKRKEQMGIHKKATKRTPRE